MSGSVGWPRICLLAFTFRFIWSVSSSVSQGVCACGGGCMSWIGLCRESRPNCGLVGVRAQARSFCLLYPKFHGFHLIPWNQIRDVPEV